MSKLGRKLDEIFSAATFAEAGEFETARQMLGGRKKVLLVLTGREADANALRYALNVAGRTGAALEVLATFEDGLTAAVLGLCEREAGKRSLDLLVVRKDGKPRMAVIRHARDRHDLVCVVIDSTGAHEIDGSTGSRSLSSVWKKLGCPLVLVSGKLGAIE